MQLTFSLLDKGTTSLRFKMSSTSQKWLEYSQYACSRKLCSRI